MAPETRNKTMKAADVIVIHDSDSDLDTQDKHISKRRKTRNDTRPYILSLPSSMSSIASSQTFLKGGVNIRSKPGDEIINVDEPSSNCAQVKRADKNAHLKGRKRFNADLEDIKQEAKNAFTHAGLQLEKVRAGEDEGIELIIVNSQSEHVLAVNLVVSDTSDYPQEHSFFCYSPDDDLPSHILEVLESVASAPSRPIIETVLKLLSALAKTLDADAHQESQHQSQSQDIEMEDEGSDEDYDAFDDYNDFDSGVTGNSLRLLLSRLQMDFIDIVATGYRPGFIHFTGDDFAVSVSIPVVTLAESIPPHALRAWDRRLLSRSQHLTLLISGFRGTYPTLDNDGTYGPIARQFNTSLSFKVGLTRGYKPGKEYAKDAARIFGLVTRDAEDELLLQAEKAALEQAEQDEWDMDPPAEEAEQEEEEEEEEDDGRFDRFSLSSSLESLLDQAFLKLVQYRRRFSLGWAGAEVLFAEVEKTQRKTEDIFEEQIMEILEADKVEAQLRMTNALPHDPLAGLGKSEEINLPLTAFCYFIRRLSLCPRYCIVCHNKLNTDFEALKPYVCDSKLCAYQYYTFNRGPSLEYEILHNPQTVDLLVSIAYVAAVEKAMDEPLPVGLGLRVPVPDAGSPTTPLTQFGMHALLAPTAPPPVPAPVTSVIIGQDGLCDFDELSLLQMRASIAHLINMLPSIDEMRRHLQRKTKLGESKPKLRDLDPAVLPAAWSILRWCVASCTAHLEEITSNEELVQNLDPTWRQYRFTVGAPDAEAKFKTALLQAQANNANAHKFPSLYAFHGSAMRNWHSIIRHGLWYKTVVHGRAYGDGVYLAKDGNVSMGGYAQGTNSVWRHSKLNPTNCVALAEIVNLPAQFVSSSPYFVIKDTHWIMCRYLLVKGTGEINDGKGMRGSSTASKQNREGTTPFVELDPTHPITLNAKKISIPDPSYQIEMLLEARKLEYVDEDHDEEDVGVFEYKPSRQSSQQEVIVIHDDDDDDSCMTANGRATRGKGKGKAKAASDWEHDPDWVNEHVVNLLPPPVEASLSATMAVQREMRAMLQEQERADSLMELGWYMAPELIGDNLFQWIVEMHSFDPEIPIAKDLKAKGLNSLIFEIRFPPSFPLAPPFFRIVTPRFLPFIHGGGGHITGGGSICMDLLTSDGWLPSYSMPAILMQIKLAISNLDPRPARLAHDWNRPYQAFEALEGYKRAAATHGWKVPVGLDNLIR